MNNKELLRKAGRLGNVDPKELETFEEWVEYLESIISGPFSILLDSNTGKPVLMELKARIASINGLRIDVYPNEHTPPHFHVKSPKINASFRIDDCSIINGEIGSRDYQIIYYWYQSGAKEFLIEKWNQFRPTNCVVGKFISRKSE